MPPVFSEGIGAGGGREKGAPERRVVGLKRGANVPSTPFVKALVGWATDNRSTHRLHKLGLITLSPPLNTGILGLRMGPYVPTPKFFTISGDPGRVIYDILDMRKFTFLLKAFSWWT